jgi:ATP-dependent DNA helicase II
MESADELLEHLDPEQREVATRFGVPLCVRAGAGTGKTRAITYRIAYAARAGILDPRNVMALTFTSRAAGELRSRLRDLGVRGASAHTFHAAALRQLSYFWGTAIGGAVPPIAENKLSMVAQAAGQLGMTTDSVSLRDMASEIEWSRVSLVTPDDYPDRARSLQRDQAAGYPAEEVARLIRAYEDVKQNRGVIDFEDVLLLLIGILIDRPDVARMVRDQYRHFVVDEYQDVSPLQHRLLQLWMGERRDLCVVGDVSQTIYSFAGASSRYLADFAREFRGAQILELIRDYRSSPQIVACANEVIAPDASKGAVRLVSQLPSSVPVVFKEYGDDVEEAEAVAAEILQLRERGVGLADIAVLYRTNAQSAELEAALGRAGVDYSVRGSERFFSRREVREAMVGMRAAARAEAGGSLADDVKAVLMQRGWREQPPEGAGAARERWSALAALLKMAEEMEQARGAGMAEFVAELEERAQIQAAPETDSVTLASLHSAKGLEWHAVFLVGMSEGLMPISLAKGEEAIGEERRLMYVGITRAKQCLQISYAKGNGQRSARKMSRFLQGTWPRPSEPVSRATSYRERKAAAAQQFAAEHEDDVPLFEALVEWRLEASRRIDKPAYVILHDSTLRAVAVAKPATLAQLGKIRGIGASKLAEWGEEILGVVARSRSGR